MKRRVSKNSPKRDKITIAIACEDSSGGLEYIKSLIRSYGFNVSDTCSTKKHERDPKNLVEIVKKSTSNYKFVFIDIDDNCKESKRKRLNEAVKIARDNDICIFFSNECLEIWYLLHFQEVTNHMSRNIIFEKLIKHLKKKPLTKEQLKDLNKKSLKSINMYDILDNDEREIAYKRCKKMIKNNFSICEDVSMTLLCYLMDNLNSLREGKNLKCFPKYNLKDKK